MVVLKQVHPHPLQWGNDEESSLLILACSNKPEAIEHRRLKTFSFMVLCLFVIH